MRASKTATPEVHLNLNVRGLPVSATLAINELSNRLRREGRRVYRLGLGQSPFPVPQPVVEELKANAHQKDYLPVLGLHELREAVSDYYCRTQGLSREPDGVMIGPGSKELMFLVQLVYYGDLVIPTPSWVSYAPQAHIIGRQIRWLPTREAEGWKITPAAVEMICREDPQRPRLIILNYPNNPSGATYLVEELKALALVARKYRVLLLSDEIYGELNHKGVHVSIARYYPEGTIISSGLSKWCGAGGWRLGTFVFPRSLYWLRDAMAAVASETFTSTSAPIQYAAVRAFQGGMEIERYLWQSRRILRALGRWCYHHLMEAGIHAVEPKGAFYLFVNFEAYRPRLAERGIFSSEQLCRQLLEDTGVAILPGRAFGRPAEELTARLAYVDFDGSRALAAAEQVPSTTTLDEAFLRTYCHNVLEAIELMGQWAAR
ncbi:MAG: aminotransferase class I/II-fold pyridoxal phosphate-dependent enzyme [Calditrichaeota bacterium]|nr:MAG: aminotransferase class I/II-fold pyridoxal phosphate-dependent enzyme [Calditrichota bacterium]